LDRRPTNPPPASDEGEVVEQYSWSPFGRLLAVDEMAGISDALLPQNGYTGGLYHDYRIGVGQHGLFAETMGAEGQAFQPRANPLRMLSCRRSPASPA
tara:strand:+ start:444 stop:737 length:294 start_codon:yes stop_codon:yes gene_type:complete